VRAEELAEEVAVAEVQLDRVAARPKSSFVRRSSSSFIARATGIPESAPYALKPRLGPAGPRTPSSVFLLKPPACPSCSIAAAPAACTASVRAWSGATFSGRITICSAKVRPSGETLA
jgi:hypothetical protein